MKTKKSETKGKGSPNPFEVAREAIEEAYGSQIGELHYTIQNELKGDALYKLYRAINPKHDEIENRFNELLKKATSDGQDQLIADFDSVWGSRAIIMQDAGFLLGIAFAQHLKGGTGQ